MRRYAVILLFGVLIFSLGALNQASAKVYTYTDDEGKVWYVGSPEDIPARYRSKTMGQKISEDRRIPPSRSPSFFSSSNLPSTAPQAPRGFLKRFQQAAPSSRPQEPFPRGVPIQHQQAPAQEQQPSKLEEVLDDTLDVTKMPENFNEDDFLKIKVIGRDFFISWIEGALNILVERAPIQFKKIREQVGIIKQGKRTMMWTKLDPPIMTISIKSATHTSTFTAGIIAHESCHMRLFREGKESDPTKYDEIKNEEMTCIKYEKKVMEEIDAPVQELEMIDKQDGTHFDVNKDGKYNLDDFQQMNW